MDYKDSANMDGVSYPDVYESAAYSIAHKFGLDRVDVDVIGKLKEKRRLGVVKYGEYSFQSSLNKTLSAPTMEHLKEELLDAFNYLIHEHIKASFLYPAQLQAIGKAINDLTQLYKFIVELEQVIKGNG
jgi:hypothetical protein